MCVWCVCVFLSLSHSLSLSASISKSPSHILFLSCPPIKLTLIVNLALSLSLTNTQTHKHTNTQTHKHTNTQTHKHTNTQTHKHTKVVMTVRSKYSYSIFFLNEGQLLDVVSQRTAGFLFSDLRELVQKSILQNYRRVRQQNSFVYDVFSTSFKLVFDDFETSLKDFEDILADSIGAPKVPNVTWQDVGKLNVVRLIVMAPFLLQRLYF